MILCLSSLPLSRLVSLSWHIRNFFLLKTRFIVVPLLLLLLLLILFDSVMRRHEMTYLRTFLTRQFIQNDKSFYLTFQTLLYPVHLTLRNGLLFVRNPQGVPTYSYRSFYSNVHAINISIPRFTIVFQGTCIVVTSKLIFEVLHVLIMDRLDYPSHRHLSFISKDELASLFYEKAMLWGGTLNFSKTEFAKGPQIFNMVMTFVLIPQSHYNTITEPRAHFLLSLMEGLSIDFPSHMILSIIDCYQDTTTHDKLIFPSTITYILTHMHVTIPPSPLFHVMGAISKEYIWRRATQLVAKQPCVETMDAAPTAPSSRPSSSTALVSSSKANVSLINIME